MEAQHAGETKDTSSHDEGGASRTEPVKAAMLEKEELGHPARSLLRQLRQNLPLFSPAEQLIGEYVLAHPRQVLRLPTDQLAKLESIVHLFGQEDEQPTSPTRGKE
jgi:hypothetical protein